jgi:4-hydroxyphenylpyruvate dioxygenase-like putative hemolysin
MPNLVQAPHSIAITLCATFSPAWGLKKTATHKTKTIEPWQQGDITYVLNPARPAGHVL